MAKDELRDPLRAPVRDFGKMTAAELDAFVAQESGTDKFAVPDHLIPDGMTYQWVRCEVYGKPDPQHQAEMEQRNWKPVPENRHPGRWTLGGSDRPIVVDGLMLMEIPTPLFEAKRRFGERQAKGQVRALEEQMIYAPPGTAPRDAHPKTRPVMRRTVERPMEVE